MSEMMRVIDEEYACDSKGMPLIYPNYFMSNMEENPQTRQPTNSTTIKPDNLQSQQPAIPITSKPANPTNVSGDGASRMHSKVGISVK